MDEKRLRRVKYIVEHYGLAENTLRWYFKTGRLTKHKFGRVVFVDENEILRHAAEDTAAWQAQRQAAIASAQESQGATT